MAERENQATGRIPSNLPVVNQANLAILLDALKSERWHFDMRQTLGFVEDGDIILHSSYLANDCHTCACIDGTIRLLQGHMKVTIHDTTMSKNKNWLGVDTKDYINIIMPQDYASMRTPEPVQRAAAIAMLEDLARGKAPTENWLADYIEEIKREAPGNLS